MVKETYQRQSETSPPKLRGGLLHHREAYLLGVINHISIYNWHPGAGSLGAQGTSIRFGHLWGRPTIWWKQQVFPWTMPRGGGSFHQSRFAFLEKNGEEENREKQKTPGPVYICCMMLTWQKMVVSGNHNLFLNMWTLAANFVLDGQFLESQISAIKRIDSCIFLELLMNKSPWTIPGADKTMLSSDLRKISR